MTEVDKIYVERRSAPRPPVEPIPEDTLAVWIAGAFAALSVLVMAAWLVSML